jgi:hypothetical protein
LTHEGGPMDKERRKKKGKEKEKIKDKEKIYSRVI